MYKIIDKKLGLVSCSISDLTMKQVHDFLSRWEEGASIGTLTLFYDEERNMIVLNQDNKNYELYLDIARNYMGLSEERQEEVAQEAPASLQETIKVLQQSIKVMKYQKEPEERGMQQNDSSKYVCSADRK